MMNRNLGKAPVQDPAATADGVQVVFQTGHASEITVVAISPDGATIVFAATEEGVTRLYVRRRNDADVRVLPGTDGASDPAFSPDGQWLAFAGQSDLMRMRLDGTPGPQFAKAAQFKAQVTSTFELAPTQRDPYATLPPAMT